MAADPALPSLHRSHDVVTVRGRYTLSLTCDRASEFNRHHPGLTYTSLVHVCCAEAGISLHVSYFQNMSDSITQGSVGYKLGSLLVYPSFIYFFSL